MGNREYDDSEIEELQGITFDIKGFLYKLLRFWKFILLCIAAALLVAYLINVRKQNIYRLASLISIENDQNPFFTANTSISFNWGGVSGKMGKTITTLKTRTHNEFVVDSLRYYINYLEQGKYHKIDIYKKAPFEVEVAMSKPQLLNRIIGIRFLTKTTFEIFTEFEGTRGQGQRYDTKEKMGVAIPNGPFKKTYPLNSFVDLPFFKAHINLREGSAIKPNSEYFIQFKNFDGVVNSYKSKIAVNPFDKKNNSSVLTLSLAGTNKQKIVDYLNATTSILSLTELKRKNLYATNTIQFIDSSLAAVNVNLKDYNKEMNDFRKKNKVFNVNAEMQEMSSRLMDLEAQKIGENTKLDYLDRLENYLLTKTDYTNIAAPTSVGISESNILNSVSKITKLAIERQNLEYTTREGSELFKNIDRQINAEKNVLLETINSTKSTINLQLNSISRNIAGYEAKLRGLPEDQQKFLKIQRKLDISQQAYNVYMNKRSEAAIVKAANISDITVIDEAKDIGGGFIGPNTSLNYIMGLMVGTSVPVILLFLLFIFNTNIQSSEEVERLSSIPIIGLIGKFKHPNNLVVFEKPKSPIAEAFRGIRSSLQFFYKNNIKPENKDKGKTLMVTSSVSGEGKTFCSINLATAYALSGKKTILVGLDLRKPKIFDDFKLNNNIGIVNYFIDDNSLEEVTNTTHIENLEVITSGPIPPNPSELLMSQKMHTLIETLRESYDIIVLDTPPLGLVSDALELAHYADATIFMLRFNYTKKGMLQLINAKYKLGELKDVSFVLNFYKHKTNQNYGYGYGYGYGVYGNAYHQETKKRNKLQRLVKRIFKK
ncbi:MAG: polysaccharide biosynthesis tyrosine autokinase [Oceanihabitans sp.]